MAQSDQGATGADRRVTYATGTTSLGQVVVASTGEGITAILLGDDEARLIADLRREFPQARHADREGSGRTALEKVLTLVVDPAAGFDLPLDIAGTDFQLRVWRALRDIPAGETASYSAIAERIGAREAVRAVAQACGANRIAVAIPCHRVVAADGSLSGYRWGIERKRALLDREAHA